MIDTVDKNKSYTNKDFQSIYDENVRASSKAHNQVEP